MNKKLVRAALAAVAAVAVVGAGSTLAAWSDFGEIKNNSIGAGILKLDLSSPGGGAVASIDFGKLAPGKSGQRMIWVASSNGDSVPNANLSATVLNLVDHENGFSSRSEAAVDATPGDTQGELSHILNVQSSYYPEVTTPEQCKTYPGQGNYKAFWADGQGDLRTAVGHKYTLQEPNAATPLVLSPGEGVCIGIQTYWPFNPSAQVSAPYNDDNIAQGDSLTFDVRFDLEQTTS